MSSKLNIFKPSSHVPSFYYHFHTYTLHHHLHRLSSSKQSALSPSLNNSSQPRVLTAISATTDTVPEIRTWTRGAKNFIRSPTFVKLKIVQKYKNILQKITKLLRCCLAFESYKLCMATWFDNTLKTTEKWAPSFYQLKIFGGLRGRV